ncbi:PREDICTED: E3 ubiquitin-protein ligase MARCH11 [Rhinopithecus bieti]|uniref:E3 ubiquitin-protein ligase MARCH11 n=1 Tax=Rhinopithecus bieti TaxID=61621 RepID=UPI00083BF27C|nr:PREDICTED: E3 ubiquitin-protein ligase MARCH11 [Rhinopithecus bieti]
MKQPCQWQSISITLVEKVQMIAVILGSLFLIASVTWLLWSAFSPYAVWQRKDILFQICYGMYGFMDLVCIGSGDHSCQPPTPLCISELYKQSSCTPFKSVINFDQQTFITRLLECKSTHSITTQSPPPLPSLESELLWSLRITELWKSTGLIVHEGAAVYRVFKRWRAVNLHWDVLNYDKATDIEESSRGESSTSRTLWLPLTALRNRNLVHPTQLTSPRFQCGYVLLHLFNRMRPHEDLSEDNSSGEVVMRVTSV